MVHAIAVRCARVTDNLQDRMLNQAKQALQAEPSSAEQHYNQLIDDLEGLFGKNHKEVAAELQRIAKSIEDAGDADSAFAFKQRTCEILLKRNMEQRRLNRPAAQAIPTPAVDRPLVPQTVTRILGPLEYVCMPVNSTSTAIDFYRRTLNGEQLFEHTTGSRVSAVKFAQGPALLFIENKELTACQPLFATDDLGKVLAELKKHDVKPEVGPIATGLGAIYSFRDGANNSFGIIERKPRR
jgi:hypothetical protein